MMPMRIRFRLALVMGLVLSLGFVASVSAQMSSTNYTVNEAQFGNGANLEQCSTQYCAKTSAGDLVVGNGSSANYSAQFGFNTTNEPLLEVSTVQSNSDAGVLSSATTGKVSAQVNVRSYLIKGYVMQITGSSPRINNHALTPMATTAASSAGTEQFGLNLVANTSPSIGAIPVQVPDNTFSYGVAAAGYNTANQFKYVDGDVVASSPTSTGQTNYTVSMILNISDVTPGGRYKGTLSAVVIPVY